jgi:hypothetical protein
MKNTAMIKRRIKLRAMYRDAGATCYAGETIGVEPKEADRLISMGFAQDATMTKPVTDTTGLRGFAKMKWYRDEIRSRGGEPTGNTLVGLEDQYKAVTDGA